MHRIISIFLICFILVGCQTAVKKHELAQKRVDIIQKQVEQKIETIEDKGKAFLHGAKLSIEKVPDEVHQGIPITERFIDLAKLSLGPPSFSDAKKIEEIVNGLFEQAKAEAELAKAEAAKSKAAELKSKESELKAQAELVKTKEQKIELLQEAKNAKEAAKEQEEISKQAKKESDAAKEKVAQAESQLYQFGNQIITLESQISTLDIQHKSELEKLQKINNQNAAKAEQYNKDNSFVSSLNPFKDLFSFFKKLFIWGLIIGVVVLAFNILEIFFPGLKIVSTVFGGFVKLILKLVPKAKNAAGVVSKSVYKSLSHVVKANNDFFYELEQLPIEDKLVENYPEDHQFNKKEVLNLLYQLSENTLTSLKNKLKEYTDEESRSIITYTKADNGVKSEKTDPNI